MSYTLVQFRNVIRQRLGWSATDTFVSDAELNNYINDSLAELHSLLLTIYRPGHFGLQDSTVFVLAGQNFYLLNALSQFGRLLNVTMPYGGFDYPMQPGDPIVDITSTLATTWTPWNVKYCLRINGVNGAAGELFFTRPAAADTQIHIWWLRSPPALALDTDTSWMGYDEYVVLDVMQKCRVKEEADVSDVAQQKAAFEQRIRMQAEPLDMGRATTVQDTRAVEDVRNFDAQWWRRWA